MGARRGAVLGRGHTGALGWGAAVLGPCPWRDGTPPAWTGATGRTQGTGGAGSRAEPLAAKGPAQHRRRQTKAFCAPSLCASPPVPSPPGFCLFPHSSPQRPLLPSLWGEMSSEFQHPWGRTRGLLKPGHCCVSRAASGDGSGPGGLGGWRNPPCRRGQQMWGAQPGAVMSLGFLPPPLASPWACRPLLSSARSPGFAIRAAPRPPGLTQPRTPMDAGAPPAAPALPPAPAGSGCVSQLNGGLGTGRGPSWSLLLLLACGCRRWIYLVAAPSPARSGVAEGYLAGTAWSDIPCCAPGWARR